MKSFSPKRGLESQEELSLGFINSSVNIRETVLQRVEIWGQVRLILNADSATYWLSDLEFGI